MFIRDLAAGTATVVAAMLLAASHATAQQMPAVAKQVFAQKKSVSEQGAARVFGGGDADQGAQPWLVALAFTYMLDGSADSQFDAQFCGGSIIAPAWVLTAAHCVTDDYGDAFAPGDFTVLYGDINIKRADRSFVNGVIVHEDYDPSLIENDIALLELTQPLTLDGRNTDAIEIADPAARSDTEVPGMSAAVTGWGQLEDGYYPVTVQRAAINIIDTEVCAEGLLNLYQRKLARALDIVASRLRASPAAAQQAFRVLVEDAGQLIPSTMMCAGTPSGARDSCNGDSGGPLFISRPEGAVQVGIVSWGEVPVAAESACGNPQLFGYYTRVSSYYDWINRYVQ